ATPKLRTTSFRICIFLIRRICFGMSLLLCYAVVLTKFGTDVLPNRSCFRVVALTLRLSHEAAAPSSFYGIRRLQDRRPASDLRLHEAAELGGGPLALGWDRSAKVGELRRDRGIIQGFVERAGKLVDDGLRRALGGENSRPDAHLIIEPFFFRGRYVGESRQA